MPKTLCRGGAAVLALVLAATQMGCVGSGSPWTKQLHIVVLGLTEDGSNVVPVPGATVALSSSGRSSGTQTLTTDEDGEVVFRVEPGYTFTAAVTATGYATGQVVVEVGFWAESSITRTITLARSS